MGRRRESAALADAEASMLLNSSPRAVRVPYLLMTTFASSTSLSNLVGISFWRCAALTTGRFPLGVLLESPLCRRVAAADDSVQVKVKAQCANGDVNRKSVEKW